MFKREIARKARGSAAMEQPAVKTTTVGERPPGGGNPPGQLPRGIEVLVKKASVDPSFKASLMERRSGAADEIGLLLEEAEALMLDIVPAAQLEAIIAQTRVEPAKKPAFLGKAAAVMLVALGASAITAQEISPQRGDRPAPVTTGPAPAETVIVGIVPTSDPAGKPTSQPASQSASQPASMPAAMRDEVQRLIVQLDADRFEDRQAATQKLADMGQAVVPILKEALASGKLPIEAKMRVEAILNKINPTPTPPADIRARRGATADIPFN
jgi:hypothetical protein